MNSSGGGLSKSSLPRNFEVQNSHHNQKRSRKERNKTQSDVALSGPRIFLSCGSCGKHSSYNQLTSVTEQRGELLCGNGAFAQHAPVFAAEINDGRSNVRS